MPFASKRQARWMWANHPDMAREFASATPSIKALPEKAAKSGGHVVKTASEHFQDLSMEHLMLAGGEGDVAIMAFGAELEKIGGEAQMFAHIINRAPGMLERMMGGASKVIGRGAAAVRGAGGAVAAGVQSGATALGRAGAAVGQGVGRGFQAAGKGLEQGMVRAGKGLERGTESLGKARANFAKQQALAAERKAAMTAATPAGVASAMNADRSTLGLGPVGEAAGTAESHFGLEHLNQQGGLKNWWGQATGTQKAKTLGVAAGGLYGANLLNNTVGGQH